MKKYKPNVMFVSPVPRKSVQGRDNYSYIKQSGEVVATNRSSAKNAVKKFNFPSEASGRALRTGLNRMVDNPWFQRTMEDLNDNLPEHFHVGADWINRIDKILERVQITKQLELEIRFNLPEGELTSVKNLNHNISRRDSTDKPTFLEVFSIILYDRPNRFDDTTLRSALCMELCKASRKIAENKNSINTTVHEFYIADENEAAMERTLKDDVINEAITDLTLLRRKYPDFIRYQTAVILGGITGKVSSVVVKDWLNSYIKTSTKDQLKNIESFNKINELIQGGKEGMKNVWIMYCLKQALNTNIISINGGKYLWHSKKSVENLYNLGTNYPKIVSLFSNEYTKYGIEEDESVSDNFYRDLYQELQSKGVQLD